MKRIIFALAVIMAAGCTNSRSDLVIQGAIQPPTDGTCTFTPSATTFLSEGTAEVRIQQILRGNLSVEIGLELADNLAAPSIQNANGSTVTNETENDVVVNTMEINITDASGNSVATTTVPANGYIPGGGKGVSIPDVMGKEFADALLKMVAFPAPNPGNTTMILNMVAHGNIVMNGSIQSESFAYPFQVFFDDPFAVTNSDGSISTIAILADGGAADEVIKADGTQALGDFSGGTVVPGNAIVDALRQEVLAVEGGADGGIPGANFPGVSNCE